MFGAWTPNKNIKHSVQLLQVDKRHRQCLQNIPYFGDQKEIAHHGSSKHRQLLPYWCSRSNPSCSFLPIFHAVSVVHKQNTEIRCGQGCSPNVHKEPCTSVHLPCRKPIHLSQFIALPDFRDKIETLLTTTLTLSWSTPKTATSSAYQKSFNSEDSSGKPGMLG